MYRLHYLDMAYLYAYLILVNCYQNVADNSDYINQGHYNRMLFNSYMSQI